MEKLTKIKSIKQNGKNEWFGYSVEDELVFITFKNNHLIVKLDKNIVYDKKFVIDQIIQRDFDKNNIEFDELKKYLWNTLILPLKLWL